MSKRSRRNDFRLKTHEEDSSAHVHSALNNLMLLVSNGNERARKWKESKRQIDQLQARIRDLCRQNKRFIDASPRMKNIMGLFAGLVVVVFLYDWYILGAETRILIDHWLTPFVIIGGGLYAGGVLLYLHENARDQILDESPDGNDPRLGYKSMSLFNVTRVLKFVYLMAVSLAAFYGTNEVYRYSQINNDFSLGSVDTYGISQSELDGLRDQIGMNNSDDTESDYSWLMPYIFVFFSLLLHGGIMLSGHRIFTAIAYKKYRGSYRAMDTGLRALYRRRDQHVTQIGKIAASHKAQVAIVQKLDDSFLPEDDPFNALFNQGLEEYNNGSPEDPDILREFIDGDKESKWDYVPTELPFHVINGHNEPEHIN